MKHFLPALLFYSLFCYPSISQEELVKAENNGYFTKLTSSESGIIASNNLDNALYLINGSYFRVLLENPGCGRYFSVHDNMIGFKYIDTETGLQSPAILDIVTGKIIELEKRSGYCGQISFSADGTKAFTIKNTLRISYADGTVKDIGIGNYSNLSVISPDGKYICINGTGQSFDIIDLTAFKRNTVLNDREYVDFKWSEDSKKIALSSIDGTLFVHDINSGITLEYSRISDFNWTSTDQIVYSSVKHNEEELISSELYLLDTASGKTTALTSTPDIYEMSPLFKNGKLYFGTFYGNEIKEAELSNSKINGSSIFYKHEDILGLKPIIITGKSNTKDMLDVPYINQVFSTDLYGHRYGCCAATSCAMALAYYKIIPHWQTSNNNWAHVIFDNYIYKNFTYDIRYWSDTYQTYYGTGGGDGFMWNDNGHGGASPSTNQKYYLQQHGLTSVQYWSNFYTVISGNLTDGYMHPMCVMLTASGHLIDPIGIANAGQQLLYYNDPYGNKNIAYPSEDGAGVIYDWPGFNNGYENLSTVAWTTSAIGTMPDAPGLEVDDKQLAYGTGYDDFDYMNDGFWMLADGTTGMKYWRHVDTGSETYWWTGAMTGTSVDDYCASWDPVIQYPGDYNVEVFIPSDTELITNAKYQVHHNGTNDIVIVDQSANAGSWVGLGTFLFAGTDDEFIYLGDATGSKTVKIPHDEKEKVFKIVYDRIRLTQVTPEFTAGGDWQYGTDSLVGSVSGGNIWGTVLNADHSDNTNSSLEWNISDSPLPSASVLTFDHWFEAEAGSGTTAYDGGNVKISVDGGSNWSILVPDPGYTHVISTGYTNPMPGETCYSGSSGGWVSALIDLSSYSGENVLIKWQFGSDSLYNYRGWYLDNISVSQLSAPLVPEIIYNGTSVELSWNAVENATGYIIYASDDPSGAFTQTGTSSENTWTGTESGPKKFYKITSLISYK